MPVGYFKLYTYFTVFQITLSMNMVYVKRSKSTWGIAVCRMKCDYFYKTMLQKSVRKNNINNISVTINGYFKYLYKR